MLQRAGALGMERTAHRARFRAVCKRPDGWRGQANAEEPAKKRCWDSQRRDEKRMGWDSNPRYAQTYASFQDWCLRPLGHPSFRSARRRDWRTGEVALPLGLEMYQSFAESETESPARILSRCPRPTSGRRPDERVPLRGR